MTFSFDFCPLLKLEENRNHLRCKPFGVKHMAIGLNHVRGNHMRVEVFLELHNQLLMCAVESQTSCSQNW